MEIDPVRARTAETIGLKSISKPARIYCTNSSSCRGWPADAISSPRAFIFWKYSEIFMFSLRVVARAILGLVWLVLEL